MSHQLAFHRRNLYTSIGGENLRRESLCWYLAPSMTRHESTVPTPLNYSLKLIASKIPDFTARKMTKHLEAKSLRLLTYYVGLQASGARSVASSEKIFKE